MNALEKAHILSRRRRNNGLPRLLIGVTMAAILLVGLIGLSGLGAVAGVYAYYAKDLPAPEAIVTAQEHFETTKIYDRTGQHLLYEIFDPHWGDRTIVPLHRIPKYLREATIAIEDKNFYQNPGINPRGLARAVWSHLAMYVKEKFGFDLPYSGVPTQGGSSITMQLVKNVLIPPEERYKRLVSRKIKEVILSLEISRLYSKDQILEWYLNNVYYGNLAYGVEAAAQVYFGKHVEDLNLAECAMLAALPQSPALNPIDAPEEARKRQHLVLDAMALQGYITWDEARAAKFQKLDIKPREERFDIRAPHFSIYVRKKLEEMFGPDMVYRGGLRVYTTLDLKLQNLAEKIARQHVAKLQKEGYDVSNAAVVALRPNTGEILVMVGSLDYWNEDIKGQVNMALAPRQPGSAFKPFTYVTAFAQGYTPATMVMDVRTAFPDPPHPPYVPENYSRKYHGPVRLRQALACSYNMPAVWLLSKVGVKNVINTAHRLGITTLNEEYYGLSLTLGGGEVRLLDMAYAFGVFANGGVMAGVPVPEEERIHGYREVEPVAILRVEDSEGNILWQYNSPETREVMSPQLAYLITDSLADNEARAPAFGLNSPLKLSRPAAAKTGTTNDYRDAWTIGYTPQLVCGVWVGNADNQPMGDVPGVRGAAPIWHDFMEEALKDEPVKEFVRPPGFEEVEVCSVSGLLPTEHCPHTVKEIFIKGTAPTTYCNVHQVFRINRETGKLATIYTPPELVEERVYEIYPPEAADWVRENEIPQPPTQYDTAYGPSPTSGEVAITSPAPYAYVRGLVPIMGNARADHFQLYRLEYGQGINPSAWIQIGGDHYNQVSGGQLELWDASGLDGLYTLQLSVVEKNGNYKQAAIQVTVDNTPPTVKLIYPYDGAVYVLEEDEYVNIQAEAVDNYSMDRVEYYLDGELLGYSTVPPYNTKWNIVADGTHEIYVVAIDAAGNKAESEKVKIHVKHKKGEQ